MVVTVGACVLKNRLDASDRHPIRRWTVREDLDNASAGRWVGRAVQRVVLIQGRSRAGAGLRNIVEPPYRKEKWPMTSFWGLNMAPDTVFIVAGALPLVAAAAYRMFHLRSLRAPVVEAKMEDRELVEV